MKQITLTTDYFFYGLLAASSLKGVRYLGIADEEHQKLLGHLIKNMPEIEKKFPTIKFPFFWPIGNRYQEFDFFILTKQSSGLCNITDLGFPPKGIKLTDNEWAKIWLERLSTFPAELFQQMAEKFLELHQ